jgi:START domain
LHEHFAEKAGNRGIIHDLAEDEHEVLFRKESRAAGNANLGSSFINQSMDNKGKRSSILPEINQRTSPGKRDLMMGAAGDDHMDANHDDSQATIDSSAAYAAADVDRDFAYLRYHLGQNASGKEWKTLVDDRNGTPKVVIQGKLDKESVSKITLRCESEIDLPKNIILKAITDMNIRPKWDQSLGKLEVLEHDKRNDVSYVRVSEMQVPEHMQPREAVLVRKVMRDFPDHNKNTIVHRSVDHALAPANAGQKVRAQFVMNGMIVEDDSTLRGTKISWIMVSDLGGCLPQSMLVR